MPGTQCKVCNSEHRGCIEEQCHAGVSARNVSTILRGKCKASISHTSISNHMKHHMDKQAPETVSPALTEMNQCNTDPIDVSMSQIMYGLEARVRYLEALAYRNLSDDIISQWSEVDEQGTQHLTIRNKEIFRAIVPSGDTVLEDEQRMNRSIIDKIKKDRGSAEKTEEKRIERKIAAIHAEEQRMREEETDFEQREIDVQNAANELAEKQAADRVAYIQNYEPGQ